MRVTNGCLPFEEEPDWVADALPVARFFSTTSRTTPGSPSQNESRIIGALTLL
jgi:hypothetical protein